MPYTTKVKIFNDALQIANFRLENDKRTWHFKAIEGKTGHFGAIVGETRQAEI